jgi:outer membrane lipoprotein-sorting protein
MRKTSGLLCCVIFFLGILFLDVSAQEVKSELTAEEIINKMNGVLNPDTVKGKMKMTIFTTSGRKRTFLYETYSANRGESVLMIYLEPSRLKGQKILTLNNSDDIWVYFVRTKRVRKLASHAKKRKVEGSDFSYEDMGSGDAFIEKYDSKLLGTEKKEKQVCWKIELTRKEDSDATYSRLILWVVKENYFPLAIEYYDEEDHELLIKELVQYDLEVIDGLPTAKRTVMYNKLDKTYTEMEMIEVRYNIKIDKSMFSERGLRK